MKVNGEFKLILLSCFWLKKDLLIVLFISTRDIIEEKITVGDKV